MFCYYCLNKVYFVPDQFSVNGFFLIGLFVCCFQSLANLFPGGGEFDLKIFPRGWGFWYDLIRAFFKSPYVPRVWGGGGFNWLVHYYVEGISGEEREIDDVDLLLSWANNTTKMNGYTDFMPWFPVEDTKPIFRAANGRHKLYRVWCRAVTSLSRRGKRGMGEGWRISPKTTTQPFSSRRCMTVQKTYCWDQAKSLWYKREPKPAVHSYSCASDRAVFITFNWREISLLMTRWHFQWRLTSTLTQINKKFDASQLTKVPRQTLVIWDRK